MTTRTITPKTEGHHMTAPGSDVNGDCAPREGYAVTSAPSPEPLTLRQYEVLAAVARFGTHQGAADALGIRRDTVKNHLYVTYGKLGVDSILGALYVVGWITIPEDPRATQTKDRAVGAAIDLHWALDVFLDWSIRDLRGVAA